MKRSIAVVVAVVALLFASAGPSGAGRGDDHDKKHKSERCHDEYSCKGSGNDDCRNAKKKCSDDDLNINICVLPGSCVGKDKPEHDSGEEPDEDEDEYADDKPDEEQEPEQPAPDEEEEEEDEYADEG